MKIYIENLSKLIMERLTKDKNIDREYYLKCKLGLENLIINISKSLAVYAVAFIVGILLEVFIFHLSYTILRNYAMGTHSSSSLFCTVFSVVTLVGLPLIIVNRFLEIEQLFILMILNVFFAIKYAPNGTKKYIIKDVRKKQLKVKSVVVLSIYILILLLDINLIYKNLIVLGATLEIIIILPVTYKFIK